MNLRILTLLVANSLIALILFLAISGPIAMVFDTVQDAANETLDADSATTVSGHFAVYRGLFGLYCLISIIGTFLYYALSRLVDQQKPPDWMG